MVSGGVVLALLAAAVAAAPPDQARARRLRAVLGSAGGSRRPRPRLPVALLRAELPPAVRWSTVVGCAIAVGCLIGPAAGVAAALVAAAGLSTAATALDRRVARRADDAVLEAVGALAGELRAGLGPPAALRAAAAVASGPTAVVLREAASTVALGGDAASALSPPDPARGGPSGSTGERPSGSAAGLRRIAAGWRVSVHSGASLSDVLDRVEGDLRSDQAQLRRIDAELAGPRATAGLLAVLPALGLALGATMGAHPVHVLLHTVPGQLALMVGAGLDAAGVWWTARIIGAAQGAT